MSSTHPTDKLKPKAVRVPGTVGATDCGDVPSPTVVPAKIEDLGNNYLRQVPDTQAGSIKDSKELAQKVAGDWVDSLFVVDKADQFASSLTMIVQLSMIRLGIGDTTTLLAHPQNAAKLLIPAIDAILQAANILQEDAPMALDGIDLHEVTEQQTQLAFLRRLKAIVAPLSYGLEALETHFEAPLDRVARQVQGRTESLIANHYRLNEMLDPVTQYVKINAITAVDTKKAYAKVAAATEKKTLEKVKQNATGTTGTPQAGAPQGSGGPAATSGQGDSTSTSTSTNAGSRSKH